MREPDPRAVGPWSQGFRAARSGAPAENPFRGVESSVHDWLDWRDGFVSGAQADVGELAERAG